MCRRIVLPLSYICVMMYVCYHSVQEPAQNITWWIHSQVYKCPEWRSGRPQARSRSQSAFRSARCSFHVPHSFLVALELHRRTRVDTAYSSSRDHLALETCLSPRISRGTSVGHTSHGRKKIRNISVHVTTIIGSWVCTWYAMYIYIYIIYIYMMQMDGIPVLLYVLSFPSHVILEQDCICVIQLLQHIGRCGRLYKEFISQCDGEMSVVTCCIGKGSAWACHHHYHHHLHDHHHSIQYTRESNAYHECLSSRSIEGR